MAFDDILARDPKSEEEFWTIIEETFVQVKASSLTIRWRHRKKRLLAPFAAETSRTRHCPSFAIVEFERISTAATTSSSSDGGFCSKSSGKSKRRKLTPKFAKDWGVVMMCHGFISAHILDDSDGLSHNRGGLRSVESSKHECAEEVGRASNSRSDDSPGNVA